MKKKIIPIGLAGAAVVALVVLALLLFKPGKAETTVPPGARAGDVFLESVTVEIDGIGYRAERGTLVVAENRGDPASRLIALPVERVRTNNPRPAAPVFRLGGGPGMSNLGGKPRAFLLAGRDVVRVGYRGVDGAPKLDSPEFAAALLGRRGDLLSDESLDNLGKAMTDCVARFKAGGIDLSHYTAVATADDLEDARVALGCGRIDLLSESYGTRVAQIYAARKPESLRRSAMIGVNPPGHFLWLPATVDSQVEYYDALWKKQAGSAAPDLAGAMRRVNANMAPRWLFFPIDPGKVRTVAFAMLYHRTSAPLVFDAYLAADKGDPSGLALMSAAYDFILPGMMTWGEFLAKGASADYEPGRDYRAELDAPGSILGSPMAQLIWGSVKSWSPGLIPEEYRRVRRQAAETLLISGSIDFSTPARFAEEELLPALPNGRHVVIAEQGHVEDFWRFQPKAAERLLASFFDTGKADASLYEYRPMKFEPVMSFPALAKIGLAAAAVLSLLIGFIAWRIVRRLRHGRAARG